MMKVNYHDPENYTISVRKEMHDSEELWVARVAELPDIMEFGDSREDAYSSALFTIKVGQEMCLEDGTPFPAPIAFETIESPGRVTLRLRASTKALAVRAAEREGVSLNSYLTSCVERDLGFNSSVSYVTSAITELVEKQVSRISGAHDALLRGFGQVFNSTNTINIMKDRILQIGAIGDSSSYDDFGFTDTFSARFSLDNEQRVA